MSTDAVLSTILIATPLFCFYGLWRNEWVFHQRIKVLNHDHQCYRAALASGRSPDEPYHPNYDRLPSYNRMFWSFWVWDVNYWLEHYD